MRLTVKQINCQTVQLDLKNDDTVVSDQNAMSGTLRGEREHAERKTGRSG
jgi:hypothetical protein